MFFFRFAVTLKSLKSNIFLKYMIIYIRFTTKDTSSKYITCTLVVSELSVLKPYKYMSLSNILKPYIFYLSSDCETFFNIWKHKSIACVFKLLPLYSLKSRIQLRYQASNEPVHGKTTILVS